jgi:hypothetical protein
MGRILDNNYFIELLVLEEFCKQNNYKIVLTNENLKLKGSYYQDIFLEDKTFFINPRYLTFGSIMHELGFLISPVKKTMSLTDRMYIAFSNQFFLYEKLEKAFCPNYIRECIMILCEGIYDMVKGFPYVEEEVSDLAREFTQSEGFISLYKRICLQLGGEESPLSLNSDTLLNIGQTIEGQNESGKLIFVSTAKE